MIHEKKSDDAGLPVDCCDGKVSPTGLYVRHCRGTHYHITTTIGDLIFPEFATPEEAWAEIERYEAELGRAPQEGTTNDR